MSSAPGRTRTSDPTKILVATLIAISTILGALFAWRASSASGGASGADESGLAAVSNVLEVSNLTRTSVYQHLQGYVRYLSNRALAESVDAEAARKLDEVLQNNGQFDDPVAEGQIQLLGEQLAHRAQESLDRAAMSQYFLNTDYLQQNGSYDYLRETGEQQAEASRYRDVDPERHFERANALRAKTNNLLTVLLVLSVAVWCFVLANALKKPRQYVPIVIGSIILVVGGAAGAWIEFLS